METPIPEDNDVGVVDGTGGSANIELGLLSVVIMFEYSFVFLVFCLSFV